MAVIPQLPVHRTAYVDSDGKPLPEFFTALRAFLDWAQAIETPGGISLANATAITAGGSAAIGLLFSSTANFGIFFGSGAPTISAAKGSLYLRSDGTTTNDRAYINTNGSTNWTALTTVA